MLIFLYNHFHQNLLVCVKVFFFHLQTHCSQLGTANCFHMIMEGVEGLGLGLVTIINLIYFDKCLLLFLLCKRWVNISVESSLSIVGLVLLLMFTFT